MLCKLNAFYIIDSWRVFSKSYANGKIIYNTYIHRSQSILNLFANYLKKITTILQKTQTEVKFNSLFTFPTYTEA
jgi:hypothetical protein